MKEAEVQNVQLYFELNPHAKFGVVKLLPVLIRNITADVKDEAPMGGKH